MHTVTLIAPIEALGPAGVPEHCRRNRNKNLKRKSFKSVMGIKNRWYNTQDILITTSIITKKS